MAGSAGLSGGNTISTSRESSRRCPMRCACGSGSGTTCIRAAWCPRARRSTGDARLLHARLRRSPPPSSSTDFRLDLMTRQVAAVLAVICAAAALEHGVRSAPADNWPGFRGPSASGVADGQRLPDTWDGVKGTNIRWKVAVPGLAHSSPIVWGDRVFVTSAMSSRADATFKPGLYGAGTASEDRTAQRGSSWRSIAATGERSGPQTAYKGEPKEKRHIKATYANATPATNGRYRRRLLRIAGALRVRHERQADLGEGSRRAQRRRVRSAGVPSGARRARRSSTRISSSCSATRRTSRSCSRPTWPPGRRSGRPRGKELPSWGTPTIYEPASGGRAELVTNASNFIRGYDPETGEERWRLGGSSKITAPTPVFSKDLVIVASGRAPERPIFAIKPGGERRYHARRGPDREPARHVAQDRPRFVHADAAHLRRHPLRPRQRRTVRRVRSRDGRRDLPPAPRARRQRLQRLTRRGRRTHLSARAKTATSSSSAAGRTFELLAKNPMGEPLMATPALAGGMMIVRGEKQVFAVAR